MSSSVKSPWKLREENWASQLLRDLMTFPRCKETDT